MNQQQERQAQQERMRSSLRSELVSLQEAIVLDVFRRQSGVVHIQRLPVTNIPDNYDEHYTLIKQLNQTRIGIIKRMWNAMRGFIDSI